jgi:hypothetical protein
MLPLLLGAVFAVSTPFYSSPEPTYLEASLPHYTAVLEATDPFLYPVKEVPATSTEELIKEVFGRHAPTALKIAKCESNLVATATLKTVREDSRGILMVNVLAHPSADPVKLYEPDYNIRFAKTIYDRAGSWLPWKNCAESLNLL